MLALEEICVNSSKVSYHRIRADLVKQFGELVIVQHDPVRTWGGHEPDPHSLLYAMDAAKEHLDFSYFRITLGNKKMARGDGVLTNRCNANSSNRNGAAGPVACGGSTSIKADKPAHSGPRTLGKWLCSGALYRSLLRSTDDSPDKLACHTLRNAVAQDAVFAECNSLESVECTLHSFTGETIRLRCQNYNSLYDIVGAIKLSFQRRHSRDKVWRCPPCSWACSYCCQLSLLSAKNPSCMPKV